MPLLSEATAVYAGDVPAQKVYLGDTLVWEPPSIGPGPYPDRIKSLTPLSYWRLGETGGTVAIDQMNLYDGTYTGSPTLGGPSLLTGDVDTAMQVSGVINQGMSAGNPPDYWLQSLTLEAWIKTSHAGASYRGIVVKQDGYGLFAVDNVLSVYEWATGQAWSSGVNIADGLPHHVVVAFQSAGSQMYVDGIAVGPAFNHTTSSHGYPLTIGYAQFSGQEFSGVIDEVAIYNRALTADEVADNYLAGTTGGTWTPADMAGLMVWLDADQVEAAEGTGLTGWADSSGNGINAVTTTTAKPVYHADGINGHPALWFGEAGFSQMDINHGRTLGDRTIFVVVRFMGNSFGAYHNVQVQELPPYMQTYTISTIHSYANPDLDSGVAMSGTCQFITVWGDSAIPRHSLEVDGVRVDAPTWTGPYASNSKVCIGGFLPGGYAMNGYIGEYLIYDRCLTDAEREQVQTYLSQKWAPAAWTPENIPSLAAWFDPKQDLFADGERITSYREHSPSGKVFAGHSPGAEPVFRAGGNPYIEFQGGGHFQYDTWNAGPVGLTFVAVNSLTTPAQPMMLIAHHSSNDGYEMRWDSMQMTTAASWQTQFSVHLHTVPDGQDVKQQHMWRFNVSNQVADAWVGSVQESYQASVMPNVPSYLFLGVRYGGYFYTGKLYEALVFEGAVSDADLTKLRDYLRTKHSLP